MVPTKETRICSKCGDNKQLEQFSLSRGRHSTDRKTYCVSCETLTRKARKQYDLDLDRYKALMARPCSVCGDKATHIDKADNVVNGVLCSRCYSFLKSVDFTDDENIIQHCCNYLAFREFFPFWLKMELNATVPEPETPLLDLMQ